MTVQKLIERLSCMPQDMDVAYSLEEEGYELGEASFGTMIGQTIFDPYIQRFKDGSEMVIL
jgi:hypothetical protein